jgi:hypothetical protein
MLIAIILTVRSITGWLNKKEYSQSDRYLAIGFLVMLYLTLINGLIMYFFIDPALKASMDMHAAIKRASLRFWVVEHFYFMTFALILAQIGGIFIRKATNDRSRFAYASFYYGIATFITIVSLTFYFLYR